MALVPMLTLCILAGAIALVVVALVRGPSVADRVVALDVLAAVAIGVIAAYTVATGAAALLDAALVLALVAFVGTVAFARFVEQRPRREGEPAGDPESQH
jgi:multicomponent Na+:H+ antiporter subunit F